MGKIFRIALAVGCAITAVVAVRRAISMAGGGADSTGDLVVVVAVGLLFFVGAALLISSLFTDSVARSGSAFLSGMFSGGDKDAETTAAEILVRQYRYDEAYEAFQKIAQRHPRDSHAYVRMIEVACQDLEDKARVNRAYRQGLENLKGAKQRELLKEVHQRNQTSSDRDAKRPK